MINLDCLAGHLIQISLPVHILLLFQIFYVIPCRVSPVGNNCMMTMVSSRRGRRAMAASWGQHHSPLQSPLWDQRCPSSFVVVVVIVIALSLLSLLPFGAIVAICRHPCCHCHHRHHHRHLRRHHCFHCPVCPCCHCPCRFFVVLATTVLAAAAPLVIS